MFPGILELIAWVRHLERRNNTAHLPFPSNITHAANRLRCKHRPDEPHGLDFELAEDYIPEDFLVQDISMYGARHVLFSVPHQFALLARAWTWYINGTFGISREPFHQFFSIHAFVKGDCGSVKASAPGLCLHDTVGRTTRRYWSRWSAPFQWRLE